MTRRRWIADEVSGNRAALVGVHAEHLARVLQVRIGQEFDVVCDGVIRHGRVASVAAGRVEFELGGEIPVAATANVTLLLSIFKFDRMEWAIEKCTELGASRIVPVIAQRTDSHLASAAMKRVERWRRIARQAAEQSRRVAAPEIDQPMKFKDAVAVPGARRVVLAESEQDLSLRDALPPHAENVILAFGPEGGWTGPELEALRQAGWVAASLGNNILRAETAAIAALAIVASL